MKRLTLVMALMVGLAQAAQLTEQRTAEATFMQVDQCTVTQTLVTLAQNQVRISTEFPDGWVRMAWITVQVDDTCAGVQLLNAAGQLTVLDGLAIDRKLDSAHLEASITVWDGISQAEGQVYVTADWNAIGPVNRGVWRTVSRAAEAVLTTEGLVTLSNFTTDASLSTVRVAP
jgi:uncharacterized membrane protein